MQQSAIIEPSPDAKSGPAESIFEAVGLECVRNDLVLFSDLSFALARGEVLQVGGANGSGKTSLLRILCGLGLPERGEVRWRGEAIHSIQPEFLSHVQYVGHSDGIKLDLTAAENLEFAGALAATPAAWAVTAVLDQAGLASCADQPVRRLSAGQRRRLALARLLLTEAVLWVLDEPFTALDADGRDFVKQLIDVHAAAGGIAVIASHESVSTKKVQVRRLSL